MRKLLLLSFLFLAVAPLFGQNTAVSSQEIATLKQKVKQKAAKTKTILSDFDQYKHLDFLSNDIKTSGKLAFKAPDIVKWEYLKPYKYSIVFKENKLFINDEGKKSDVNIGSNKLFKKINQLIIKSVSGDMFDDNEFKISYSQSKTEYIVSFLSKDAELKKYIKEFVLHFSKKDYSVNEVKNIEPSDDYTRIVFKNRKENSTLDNAIFSN